MRRRSGLLTPRRLLLATLVTLLTACTATTTSSSGACDLLPLPLYTRAEKSKLADDLDAASTTAEWPNYIADYAALYAAVKACKGMR